MDHLPSMVRVTRRPKWQVLSRKTWRSTQSKGRITLSTTTTPTQSAHAIAPD